MNREVCEHNMWVKQRCDECEKQSADRSKGAVCTEFKREDRYLVLKLKEVNRFLTQTEREILHSLSSKISGRRSADGKAPIDCVVVESDWPEYEATWEAIERRVTGRGTDTVPSSLLRK